MSTIAALSAHAFWHWWPSFFKSSGFAGVAAVVAAAIAWLSVSGQVRESEKKRRDERQVSRDQRWWDTFSWVYERTFAQQREDRMNPDASLAMLKALQDEANADGGTALQRRTVAAVSASFQSTAEPEVEEATTDTASSQRGEPVRDDDLTTVDLIRPSDLDRVIHLGDAAGRVMVSESSEDLLHSLWEDGQDASPAARAALYENAVGEALQELAIKRPQQRIYRPVAVDGPLTDFVVEGELGLVGVEVKTGISVASLKNARDRILRGISAGHLAGGVVVVADMPGSGAREAMRRSGVQLAQWKTGDDPSSLQAAIDQANASRGAASAE